MYPGPVFRNHNYDHYSITGYLYHFFQHYQFDIGDNHPDKLDDHPQRHCDYDYDHNNDHNYNHDHYHHQYDRRILDPGG